MISGEICNLAETAEYSPADADNANYEKITTTPHRNSWVHPNPKASEVQHVWRANLDASFSIESRRTATTPPVPDLRGVEYSSGAALPGQATTWVIGYRSRTFPALLVVSTQFPGSSQLLLKSRAWNCSWFDSHSITTIAYYACACTILAIEYSTRSVTCDCRSLGMWWRFPRSFSDSDSHSSEMSSSTEISAST